MTGTASPPVSKSVVHMPRNSWGCQSRSVMTAITCSCRILWCCCCCGGGSGGSGGIWQTTWNGNSHICISCYSYISQLLANTITTSEPKPIFPLFQMHANQHNIRTVWYEATFSINWLWLCRTHVTSFYDYLSWVVKAVSLVVVVVASWNESCYSIYCLDVTCAPS